MDNESLFDAPAELKPDVRPGVERDYAASPDGVNGRYFGKGATPTERASGIEIELAETAVLQRDSQGHHILRAFADGQRSTAYAAAYRATGYHHNGRREAKRLLDRLLLDKDGVLPNDAPRGRKRVDAFRITEAGLAELARLEAAA